MSTKTEQLLQKLAETSTVTEDQLSAEGLLQAQITNELYSSMLYYQMAGWFKQKNLDGFAAYFDAAGAEELKHMMKIIDYLADRDLYPVIGAMPMPEHTFTNAVEIMQKAFEHEKKITSSLTYIKKVARESEDLITDEFLNWFIHEQVEEENKAQTWLDKLSMAVNGHSYEYGVVFIDSIIK